MSSCLPPRSPAITYLPRETHCLDVCTSWKSDRSLHCLLLLAWGRGTVTLLSSLGFLSSQAGPSTDWILVLPLPVSLRLCLVLAGLIISMGDWKTVALFIGLIIFGEWQQMLQHGWTLLCRAGVLDSRAKACLCCKIFNQHPRPEASGDRTQSDMAWGHREVCVLLESTLRSCKHLHLPKVSAEVDMCVCVTVLLFDLWGVLKLCVWGTYCTTSRADHQHITEYELWFCREWMWIYGLSAVRYIESYRTLVENY